MPRKCCFEKVPGWAQSSRYGLWNPLLSKTNNRSCCNGYTYYNIWRIQGTPHRQHQQPYSTLVPGKSPSKICEIEEGISQCKWGYSTWALHRELPVPDSGWDTKLPLKQRVLHIASLSHLLQRCWFPLFHFRWQNTEHQLCSNNSDTTGGILEAQASESHKDLYISDGCGGQYKNFKNCLNWCSEMPWVQNEVCRGHSTT